VVKAIQVRFGAEADEPVDFVQHIGDVKSDFLVVDVVHRRVFAAEYNDETLDDDPDSPTANHYLKSVTFDPTPAL
jgi:hypothetical protein